MSQKICKNCNLVIPAGKVCICGVTDQKIKMATKVGECQFRGVTGFICGKNGFYHGYCWEHYDIVREKSELEQKLDERVVKIKSSGKYTTAEENLALMKKIVSKINVA